MAGVPSLKHLNFPMRMKLAVRNGMFLKPTWFEALLTSPEPANDKHKFLDRELYPEDRYRVEFQRKYPQRWIINKKSHESKYFLFDDSKSHCIFSLCYVYAQCA